jgi:hypothetical protein
MKAVEARRKKRVSPTEMFCSYQAHEEMVSIMTPNRENVSKR